MENVCLPLTYAGVPKKERRERAAIALERVGLGDRMDFKPTQLSGGQKQRVAMRVRWWQIRRFCLPTSRREHLIPNQGFTGDGDCLTDNCISRAVTIIMITHSDEIASYADRVVKIIDGELYEGDAQPVTGGDEHE